VISKEPDENEKGKNGDGVFDSLAGVYILGLVCCIAGPLAVLAGVGSLKAWFNGLHPFVIALFTVVAGVLAVVWVTLRNSRRKLNELSRRDSVASDKT
jgi:hypothetical protein